MLTAKNKKTGGIKAMKRSVEIQSYLMISLQVIGFFVFSLYPIIWVFRYAFYDYDGITATFVGLENFSRAMRDVTFWRSLVNTFIIAYGKLIIEIPLALILALVISSKLVNPMLKKFYLIGFYLPRVTGIAVNCLIFSFLFATYNGVINQILIKIGLISKPVAWFSAYGTSMFVIILQSFWEGLSSNVMFFMAGVQNISDDVLEAAEIDGASGIKKFFYITVPMIAPMIKIILMLAMINGMKVMNLVYLLTNGGPANTTNVAMLHIYKMYFESNGVPQYGYASCLGVIMTFVIGIVTCIYLKISKKADEVA